MKINPWCDDRLASNGKSISENFLSWFAESQVTDRNDLPILLFHGTHREPNGFDAFDTLSGEVGSHFGTIEQASQFVYDDEGVFLPVYLCIKNPIRLQDRGSFSGDGDEVYDQLCGLGLPEPRQSGLKGNDYLRAKIIDAGYDGVVYLNRREGFDPFGPDGIDGDEINSLTDDEVLEIFPQARDSWIAMHPHQIKSAIGNSGLYLKGNHSLTDWFEDLALRRSMTARDAIERKEVRHAYALAR